MSGADRPVTEDLQFDRVVTPSAPSLISSGPAAACLACKTPIESEYYEMNNATVCSSCRPKVEAAAETPRGMGTLLKAGVFGLGAGIAGAIVYYAVIALANLEIGIVAILIGYMVGYAVRRGAGGRGGRRFQVLAVVLTYLSVGMAYTPLAIKGALESNKEEKAGAVSKNAGNSQPVASTGDGISEDTESGSIVVALGFLIGLTAVLPVLVVFGSLPSGLISAAIIFFGMRQAWTMTRAPSLTVFGPYRVGHAPPSEPA